MKNRTRAHTAKSLLTAVGNIRKPSSNFKIISTFSNPEKQHSTPQRTMNRSEFIKRSSKALALGLLTHFSLLGGAVVAKAADGEGSIPCESQAQDNCQENNHPLSDDCQPPPNSTPDNCPGGMPMEDICDPAPPRAEMDLCPGEGDADECPTGAREEDLCMTEIPENDECLDANAPTNAAVTDQCESGRYPADECEAKTENFDKCPSGRTSDTNPDDECAKTGGRDNGDSCPGGGVDMDTCQPVTMAGDECSFGGTHTWKGIGDPNEDDCTSAGPLADICSAVPIHGFPPHVEDDSCQNGINANGNGYTDWCSPSGNGVFASDTCITGTKDDDLCVSRSSLDGMNDVCPGGGSDVDDCNAVSDDYCSELDPNSDECRMEITDPDECPGGEPDADVCNTDIDPDECAIAARTDYCNPTPPFSDPDECPTHNSKSDECHRAQDPDECRLAGDVCTKSKYGGLDICTAALPDNPE
jgi:hypothetical protein